MRCLFQYVIKIVMFPVCVFQREEVVVKNVYLFESDTTINRVSLIYNAGSRYEDAESEGVTHAIRAGLCVGVGHSRRIASDYVQVHGSIVYMYFARIIQLLQFNPCFWYRTNCYTD